jgi:hypothetical protein
MAIWDKFKEGIDKAGKAAQDVFDEGKTRIDAYRAREQADKAAEALGYAVFRAWESNAELDGDAKERLSGALRLRDDEAKKLEKELADAKAGAAPSGAGAADAAAAASAEPQQPAEGAPGASGAAADTAGDTTDPSHGNAGQSAT